MYSLLYSVAECHILNGIHCIGPGFECFVKCKCKVVILSVSLVVSCYVCPHYYFIIRNLTQFDGVTRTLLNRKDLSSRCHRNTIFVWKRKIYFKYFTVIIDISSLKKVLL